MKSSRFSDTNLHIYHSLCFSVLSICLTIRFFARRSVEIRFLPTLISVRIKLRSNKPYALCQFDEFMFEGVKRGLTAELIRDRGFGRGA